MMGEVVEMVREAVCGGRPSSMAEVYWRFRLD
jgi:hypothetical protein